MNDEMFRLASCAGKECLPSWAHAVMRARRMNRTHKGEGSIFEPYRCKVCGGIHVGSSDVIARKGRYRRKKGKLPDDVPGNPGHEGEVVY